MTILVYVILDFSPGYLDVCVCVCVCVCVYVCKQNKMSLFYYI